MTWRVWFPVSRLGLALTAASVAAQPVQAMNGCWESENRLQAVDLPVLVEGRTEGRQQPMGPVIWRAGVSGVQSAGAVSLVRVVGLRSPEISRWSRVLKVGDGYVVSPLARGGVQLFDSEGNLIRTVLETEVSSNWNLGLDRRGDTVFVFDPMAERVFLLGAKGDPLTSVPVPRASSYRILPSGDFAFTANRRTPESFGYPWHIISRSTELRSFGSPEEVLSALQDPWELEWKLAAGGSVSVWTHYRDRFKAEEWNWEDGQPTGRGIEADPGWMHTPDLGRRAPVTFLHAASFNEGHLWTLGHALQPNWMETLPADWQGEGLPIGEERAVLDTVIGVWSVKDGSVIASSRADQVMMGFAAAHMLFSIENTDTGLEAVVRQARVD